jgi:hypothetical protein
MGHTEKVHLPNVRILVKDLKFDARNFDREKNTCGNSPKTSANYRNLKVHVSSEMVVIGWRRPTRSFRTTSIG